MGSSDRESDHPSRAVRVSAVVVTTLTTLGATILASAPATAAPTAEAVAEPTPNAMTLGVLGPVGLAAIALGVLGMVAGVVRQRRKKAREVAMGADLAAAPAGPEPVANVATIDLDLDTAAVRPPGPRAAGDAARTRVTVD